jgi:hypothetical protein
MPRDPRPPFKLSLALLAWRERHPLPRCPAGFAYVPEPWVEMGGRCDDGTEWRTCPCGRWHEVNREVLADAP